MLLKDSEFREFFQYVLRLVVFTFVGYADGIIFHHWGLRILI
jgi:hypothetical protein